MSYTPGPWSVTTVPTQVGICHKIGPFPSRRPDDENCACVYVDGYPAGVELTDKLSGELRANARLISAAPDLLEALEGVIERTTRVDILGLARCTECHENLGTCADTDCFIGTARAAIAKARGES